MRPTVWLSGLMLLMIGYSVSLAAAQAGLTGTPASGGSLMLGRPLVPVWSAQDTRGGGEARPPLPPGPIATRDDPVDPPIALPTEREPRQARSVSLGSAQHGWRMLPTTGELELAWVSGPQAVLGGLGLGLTVGAASLLVRRRRA